MEEITTNNLDYNGHKPIKLFPDLYNIKPCINQSHPEYHPDSSDYAKYWEEQERRCIEGFWFKDIDPERPHLGGWRYMPPQLYYYINFCVIEEEGELGEKVSQIMHPLLRDVDWMFFYGWFTCRRFSGFKDDENYTSNLIAKKIANGDKLTPKEEHVLKAMDSRGAKLDIYKSDGTLKTYIEAREYLYKTHPKPLGKPIYENPAENFFVLGSRGWGKSFSTGNGIIGHEYNFSGQTSFEDPGEAVTIFVGAAISDKSTELLKKFDMTQERLKKEYGSWGENDDFIPGYFHLQSSGTLMVNSTSPYRNEFEHKIGGTKMKGGTGTKIVHKLFTVENPQAAVGNRCSVMVVEEVGLLDNLLAVHAANETCMIRKTKFGSAVYIGTGGNMEKIVESKIIFEEPDKYNFLGYKDVWENRTNPIGFFLPAYYVDNQFKDPNGNTDIETAFAQEVYERKIREKANNSLALDGYIMSRPIIPSEMFLSVNANVFPVAKLRERDAEIEIKKLFELRASIGTLHWNKDRTDVHWEEDLSPRRLQKPIRLLNLDSYKAGLESSIVIYEHPVENIPAPTHKKSLYKVTYDPVQDDDGGTSLASILVYKGFTDDWNTGIQNNIVAEYIGRLDKVFDIHEIALKLAYYYNALILVENNIPNFINYCKLKGFTNKLMTYPKEALSRIGGTYSKKYEYGVNMTNPAFHIHAEQLGRQWLLENADVIEGKTFLNLNRLHSPRLIRELIAYENKQKGRFDHTSSFKILMLWISNEKHIAVFKQENPKEKYQDIQAYTKSIKETYKHSRNNVWFNY